MTFDAILCVFKGSVAFLSRAKNDKYGIAPAIFGVAQMKFIYRIQ